MLRKLFGKPRKPYHIKEIVAPVHKTICLGINDKGVQLDYHHEPYISLEGYTTEQPQDGNGYGLRLKNFNGLVTLPEDRSLELVIESAGDVRGQLVHPATITAPALNVTLRAPLTVRIAAQSPHPVVDNMREVTNYLYEPYEEATGELVVRVKRSAHIYYINATTNATG